MKIWCIYFLKLNKTQFLTEKMFISPLLPIIFHINCLCSATVGLDCSLEVTASLAREIRILAPVTTEWNPEQSCCCKKQKKAPRYCNASHFLVDYIVCLLVTVLTKRDVPDLSHVGNFSFLFLLNDNNRRARRWRGYHRRTHKDRLDRLLHRWVTIVRLTIHFNFLICSIKLLEILIMVLFVKI